MTSAASPSPVPARLGGAAWHAWAASVAVGLAVGAAVFLAYLAAERRAWLDQRLTVATTAVAVGDGPRRQALFADLGVREVMPAPEGAARLLAGPAGLRIVHLDDERFPPPIWSALEALNGEGAPLLLVVGAGIAGKPAAVVVEAAPLTLRLRAAAPTLGWRSLAIAVGAAVVAQLCWLLLKRPGRRLEEAIARDPLDPPLENAAPAQGVAQTLAAMRNDLRLGAWREARLRAAASGLMRINHDLRGVLSPALLAAERLELHADVRVRAAAEGIMQAIERASGMVKRVPEDLRKGMPDRRGPAIALRPAVMAAASLLGLPRAGVALDLRIAEGMAVKADSAEFARLVAHLLRNAMEAGARRIRADATRIGAELALDIGDDGPGLPAALREAIGRPVPLADGGTGYGLAVAVELARANGGDLVLLRSGAEGTVFRLTLTAGVAAEGG